MKTVHPPYGATTAMSLIAITAGAASAALLLMFVGLFLTVISIGTTTTMDVQADARGVARGVAAKVVVSPGGSAGRKHRQSAEPVHVMDALLREERHSQSTAPAQYGTWPMGRMMRTVDTVTPASGWPQQARCLYI